MAKRLSAATDLLQKELGTTDLPWKDPKVERAMSVAQELYKGQMHWTGVSLLEHVFGVLRILAPFEPDPETIVSCLLQHALQTKQVTLPEIEEEFGTRVRGLVAGIHLLSHVTAESTHSSVEDLRLMILTVSDDIRVVLQVLCDRCYVLEHLEKVPLDHKRAICQDVLNLFAPVAARLGIYTLKQRLERLAFPIVYPSDAEHITERLELVHKQFPEFLEPAADALRSALRKQGITAEVDGREKAPYSIFLKMKAKTLSSIDGMHDLFALRVLVSSIEECYQVLGIIHQIGHPVGNRFKDYIAFPKPNGYQSLHTTVTRLPGIPDGIFIEVQVRTEEMHREAEYGVAAHWTYKQGGSIERMTQWASLSRALSSQQTLSSEEEAAPYVDHIFVLTPKGTVVELPEGATPLDFAFQIHTDLGLSFRAAKVNGAIVPLDYELENGDVVEIIKQRVPRPSPEWISLLKMASSRSRLKRYLYGLDRTKYVGKGRELVNVELEKRGLQILDADLSILKFYDGKTLSREEREDILLKIGQGSEKASALLPHLDRIKSLRVALENSTKKAPRLQRKDSLIEVEGGVRVPLKYAKCCKPQEEQGKPIVGFITRGGNVMVHREKCRMAKNGNPERKIRVWWRS